MTDRKRHIIVIGAGVIGACSTYYLSQHEYCKVTLIEQTDIACAASGKSGGFLALDWNDNHPGLKSLSRASFALHQQLNQELDGKNTYGYRTVNTYSVIFDAHLQNSKNKTPMDWTSQEKIRSFEQIGSTNTTAQLMPPLFTKRLVECAQQTGRVDVKIGKGVSRLLFQRKLVVGVELEDGEQILGDKVVVCMGPWSSLLEMPTKQDRIPVTTSHVHSIVLRPNNDIVVPNQALFTAILENGKTTEPEVYPRPDGTVYLCGAGDKEPLPTNASLVKVDKRAIESLVHQASLISPHLHVEFSTAILEKSQACYLPISKRTQMPIIGAHTNYQGLLIATGHSFWGILNAPITGKIISELALDGQAYSVDPSVMSYFVPE